MRFFKKIKDWILKSERIRKSFLRFFTKQINPRSFGSWCVKGTEESTSRLDNAPVEIVLSKLFPVVPATTKITSLFRKQNQTMSVSIMKGTETLSVQ